MNYSRLTTMADGSRLQLEVVGTRIMYVGGPVVDRNDREPLHYETRACVVCDAICPSANHEVNHMLEHHPPYREVWWLRFLRWIVQ